MGTRHRKSERKNGRGMERREEAARVATCNAERIASVETFVSFAWPNLLFRLPHLFSPLSLPLSLSVFLEALEFHFVILTNCSPSLRSALSLPPSLHAVPCFAVVIARALKHIVCCRFPFGNREKRPKIAACNQMRNMNHNTMMGNSRKNRSNTVVEK